MADDQASLSFGEGISADVPGSGYRAVASLPGLAPELSFQLTLPVDWAAVHGIPKAQVEEDSLSLLAAFDAPDETSLEILATVVPYEVNLEDWLLFQAGEHEFALAGGVSRETACGHAVHAEGLSANGGVIRVLATGNGPRVVLMIGRMAPGVPPLSRETLGLAAASFQFTHPCGLKTREELDTYVDRGGFFSLLYPRSWSPAALDTMRPAKAGLELRIAGGKGAMARLRVEADTRFPLDASGRESVSRITLGQIEEAGGLVQSLEALPDSVPMGQRWTGQCELGGRRAQLAMLFRPAAPYWLTAALLCPLKEDDPWLWMRGKRALDLAAASLRPSAAAPR